MAAPVDYSQAVSIKDPQEDCRDYLRTGRCKYGASCKYYHPPNVQSGGGIKSPLDPTEPLFPLRPREPPCQYYLKHGTCKFGQSCKFHHPPQSAGRSAMIGGSSVTMNVIPGRSSTEAHLRQTFVLNSLGGDVGADASAMSLQFLPQRPDEPDCIYFLRNGRCKYGATCRYHHPVTVQHTKSIDAGAQHGLQIQSTSQEIRHSLNDGRSRSRSMSDAVPGHVQYVAQQQASAASAQHGYRRNVGSPRTAPTHILVSDRPVSIVTMHSASDIPSLEAAHHQHATMGAPPSSSVRQDYSSMPSSPVVTSVASSYETALTEMPTGAGDASSTSWKRPSRTPSGGSLSSAYAESPQAQYVRTGSGNRVALSTSASDTNLAGRYHGITSKYGNLYAEGSKGYHQASNPGWVAGGKSQPPRRPDGSSFALDHHSLSRHEQLGGDATGTQGNARQYQEGVADYSATSLPETMRGARKSTHGQPSEFDDDGLSMMTSALLTMLDTPDEGAKGYPKESVPISDDRTVSTSNFDSGRRSHPSSGGAHHGGTSEAPPHGDSASQWSHSLQGASSVGRPLEQNIQSMAAFQPHATAQSSSYASSNGNFYLP